MYQRILICNAQAGPQRMNPMQDLPQPLNFTTNGSTAKITLIKSHMINEMQKKKTSITTLSLPRTTKKQNQLSPTTNQLQNSNVAYPKRFSSEFLQNQLKTP